MDTGSRNNTVPNYPIKKLQISSNIKKKLVLRSLFILRIPPKHQSFMVDITFTNNNWKIKIKQEITLNSEKSVFIPKLGSRPNSLHLPATLNSLLEPFFPRMTLEMKHGKKGADTVDGRNPTPVDRYFIPLFTRFDTSQVVQDVFHQQYQVIHHSKAVIAARSL